MKATKGWVAAAMGVVWLALGACGEDTTGSPAEDTLDAVLLFDTSLLADADAVGFDTLPPVDTADVDAGGDVDTIVFGDGTAGTDGGDADVSGCGGGFGCPCQQNGDCLDERCVESVDGRVCTKRCTTECPDGFDCVTTSALGDPESLCIPRHTRLCRPCRADAECQNPFDDAPGYCVAASDPDQGSFCGSSCAGGRQCPEGYQCASVATKGGGTALQCVISEGMCACRPAWDGLGYTTSCAVRNGLGACEGTRGCGELGLTPCVGPQATPEICNDVDDDCNGATDDIAATPCLVQNLFGACPGTLACGAGQTPVCQGEGAEPEACDGVDNDCNGTTDEAGCDDGLPCTVDSCDAPFQCGHVLAGGFCAISGACYAAGTPKPGDACSVCDPGRATTSWSSATGTCLIAGQCYAANAVNPANACQVCDPGQSGTGWSQAQSTCLIQGQCYAAGAQKPGQSCLRCVPEQNPSGWTAAASTTSCDDGNPCSTDDHCDGGGTCVGDTSCNDGVACTTDQCTATGCNHSGVPTGWCRIGQACYTTGTANPSNPCQRCLSATSQTTWSAQPTSVACSDGSACTAGDHCDGAGACAPGPGCSDGLSCTTDTCNPAVGCSYPTASGRCKISDACYANGDTRPGNSCYKCNAAASQSVWSFNNGAGCNDGNECTNNDTCASGSCNGSPIRDQYEGAATNDTPANAHNMGSWKDSDDFPQGSRTSTIYPSGDVDWYKYTVSDEYFADIEPRAQLQNIPTGAAYEICIHLWCTGDNAAPTELSCSEVGAYSVSAISVDGHNYPGCCTTATNIKLVTSAFECPSSDDAYKAYVRVRQTGGTVTCNSSYTINLGDD